MNKKNRFNVEEHTTLDNKIIDVFPISHRYIHDLEQQVKKQQKVIDRLIELNQIINNSDYVYSQDEITTKNLDILKEVSE